MPTLTDFYYLLGVTPQSTIEEINKAYRRLAHRWHPDRNAGNDLAAEQFKLVTRAKEVLTDSAKRTAYDEFGAASLESGFDLGRARADRDAQLYRHAANDTRDGGDTNDGRAAVGALVFGAMGAFLGPVGFAAGAIFGAMATASREPRVIHRR